MNIEASEQEWGLIYFRKKAQFNEFIEFKNKSFQYQNILGKLHFLSLQNEESNKKQIKSYIKTLNAFLEELKNILSQIHEQMKFLKLNNFASLIQSFQELLSFQHHYNIQDKINKIQYGQTSNEDQTYNLNENCQKCLQSINKFNIKKMYEEITTTEASHQTENEKMTREKRRKMISQLDEYDILIAQKQNYIRKVNSVLQNKGKVCQVSNTDKTYNFLSEYLATIEKLQEKRAKTINKHSNQPQVDQNRWQEQSYRHILEYIKRVVFQHFVSECSGPVKEMFQRINIDRLFKSYQDHVGSDTIQQKYSSMKNHETQTVTTHEGEQLKVIERKMEFKTKQNAVLKANKDELQKKYISSLEVNRKIQSEIFQIKKQKRILQHQFRTLQQNFKGLTQKYQQKIQSFEEEQRRTFENHVNQRQIILRMSKKLESDLRILQTEHKKCIISKGKSQSKSMTSLQIQTGEKKAEVAEEIEGTQQGQLLSIKRKKSIFKNMVLGTGKGSKKPSFSQKGTNLLGSLKLGEIIDNQSDSESNNGSHKLKFQSGVIKLQISLTEKQRALLRQKIFPSKLEGKQNNTKKQYKLNKYSKNKFLKTEQSLNSTDPNFLMEKQNSAMPIMQKGQRIKISMNSFRKLGKQNSPSDSNDQQKNSYKFSHFNRLTQIQQNPSNSNPLHLEQISQNDKFIRMNQDLIKEKKVFQVSERLYKKKEKIQHADQPFERIIEKGKEKFYIKKISRESINYKTEKQKIKEISQILKPYVYNNNTDLVAEKRRQSRTNLKTIRQRLSELGQSHTRFSINRKSHKFEEGTENSIISHRNSFSRQKKNSRESNKTIKSKKTIGKDIIVVQHIIESEFAYLKAVGFIDFILKIGSENKKMVKAMNKIQNQMKNKFKQPTQQDLQLFGGYEQAQNYVRGRYFWSIENRKQNMMIYTKNDGLSTKVQKYFNLLKRANPQLFGVLIEFLTNPIFVVFGKDGKKITNELMSAGEDNCFVKDLFNQLQKFHKIKHKECTHIIDFLEKIGFYRYTYF